MLNHLFFNNWLLNECKNQINLSSIIDAILILKRMFFPSSFVSKLNRSESECFPNLNKTLVFLNIKKNVSTISNHQV